MGTGGLGNGRRSLHKPRPIYRQFCTCQILFYVCLLPSLSSISPYPSKTLRICVNPITQHGRGRVGTCPPVATLLVMKIHQMLNCSIRLFGYNLSTAAMRIFLSARSLRTGRLYVDISHLLGHAAPLSKISSKSVHNLFMCFHTYAQTDRRRIRRIP